MAFEVYSLVRKFSKTIFDTIWHFEKYMYASTNHFNADIQLNNIYNFGLYLTEKHQLLDYKSRFFNYILITNLMH